MYLVIDLANQVILPQGKDEDIESWFSRIDRRLQFISRLCSRWHLNPVFVCDAGYKTDEVKEKWRTRREKEVQRCYRKIPYCADTLVCELVLKKKLDLVFDKRFNADDIVATLATMHPKNIILSRDTDYFRYDNGELNDKIYHIGYNRDVKKLERSNNYIRSPLQTIRMYIPVYCRHFTELSKFVYEGEYKRGTVFPQAERSKESSLHLATRSIRQLLYKDTVNEIFPVWDDKTSTVMWIDEYVEPIDDNFPPSLKDIETIIISRIPLIISVHHKKAIFIMAAELYSEKNKLSLLNQVFGM